MPRRWIIINALLVIFTGFWIAFLFGWYFVNGGVTTCHWGGVKVGHCVPRLGA